MEATEGIRRRASLVPSAGAQQETAPVQQFLFETVPYDSRKERKVALPVI